MKELPYFKFDPTEWAMGKIYKKPHNLKGWFIDICGIYWHRNAELTVEDLAERLGVTVAEASTTLAELSGCLVVLDGAIKINFLDEQRKEYAETQERKINAGKKGGNQKALNKMRLKASRPLAEASRPLAPLRIKIENKIEREIEIDKENIRGESTPVPKKKGFKSWTLEDFKADMTKAVLEKNMPGNMQPAFLDYWTEKSSSGLMKFQLQPTWETELRVATWMRNQAKFENKQADKFAIGQKHFNEGGQKLTWPAM